MAVEVAVMEVEAVAEVEAFVVGLEVATDRAVAVAQGMEFLLRETVSKEAGC